MRRWLKWWILTIRKGQVIVGKRSYWLYRHT